MLRLNNIKMLNKIMKSDNTSLVQHIIIEFLFNCLADFHNTTDNMKLAHLTVIDGCLYLVERGRLELDDHLHKPISAVPKLSAHP